MNDVRLDRRAFLGLGAGILGVALTPVWLRPAGRIHRLSVPVMGTIADLAVVDSDAGRARVALDAAAGELRHVEALMTRFVASSDVGRFNAAPMGTRVPVSHETAEVVRAAIGWARATGGAFDPTLEPVARLWDPAFVDRPPDRDVLRSAASESRGWTALEVQVRGDAAWLTRAPGTALDLGGIAKGWGIDRAADRLAGMGVASALVSVGGDLAALGAAPEGRPWRVGIRDPRDPEGIIRTVELTDGALATSGDYERWFEHDGVRYAHILDPKRAAPHRGVLRSVTVTAPRAVDADAAATAAFVLGHDAAIERFDGLAERPRIIHTA